jgi:hypothetical protein
MAKVVTEVIAAMKAEVKWFRNAARKHALNANQTAVALGPSKTPKMTAKDYAQLRRLKAMAKKDGKEHGQTT